MPLYRVPPATVHSAATDRPPAPVACRCCPGRQSRSTRSRCYPSDMSDREWAICEPLLPAPAWLAGKGGRPSVYCMRDVVDGVRYLTHNGPVWRALPADFPPAWTLYYWAAKWQADGSTEGMHDQLRDRVRGAGRPQARAFGGGHRFPVGPGSRGGRPGQPRIRRWQEGAGPQAAHRRGCHGPAADRAGYRGQRAGPRRGQAAAVEPAQGLPLGQAGLGPRRLRRQAGHLGQDRTQAHRTDRQAPRRPAHLPGPAPPLGGRAHPGLDHPAPAHRQRLRAAARPSRDLHLLGHDHRHDPPPGPQPDTAGISAPAQPDAA